MPQVASLSRLQYIYDLGTGAPKYLQGWTPAVCQKWDARILKLLKTPATSKEGIDLEQWAIRNEKPCAPPFQTTRKSIDHLCVCTQSMPASILSSATPALQLEPKECTALNEACRSPRRSPSAEVSHHPRAISGIPCDCNTPVLALKNKNQIGMKCRSFGSFVKNTRAFCIA